MDHKAHVNNLKDHLAIHLCQIMTIFIGDFEFLKLWHGVVFAKYDSFIFVASFCSVTGIVSFELVTHIMPNMHAKFILFGYIAHFP